MKNILSSISNFLFPPTKPIKPTIPVVTDSINEQEIRKLKVQVAELTNPKTIDLPDTTSKEVGVISKGGFPLIHNYSGKGSDGLNLFVGQRSGSFNSGVDPDNKEADASIDGSCNTGLGTLSLNKLRYGRDNTAIGKGTMSQLKDGKWNTTCGVDSLCRIEKGNSNSGLGVDALLFMKEGSANTALGNSSMLKRKSGDSNTAVGTGSLHDDEIHSENSAFGYYSLKQIHGQENAGFGNHAGESCTYGSGNSFFGGNAGFHPLQKKNPMYSTAIGYNSHTTKDNQLVLGGEKTEEILLSGRWVKLPNMTRAERNLIPVTIADAGLEIFQTDDTPGKRTYNGINWVRYTVITD